MLGLAFGRLGCFLNGCCFGAPCDLPWAIRFPAINTMTKAGPGCQKLTVSQYSYPYDYQLNPDTQRHPDQPPLLELPAEFYGYTDGLNHWFDHPFASDHSLFLAPKPPSLLSDAQRLALQQDRYPMHSIHPAQLYCIFKALLLCLILNLAFRWRRHEGSIFALMLILYGITRFLVEMLRTDSPLEFDGLTISQNLSLILVPIGLILLVWVRRRPAPSR
jgi:phosphatidylglycerol---prolipoprotein diacylglyceryl transferase